MSRRLASLSLLTATFLIASCSGPRKSPTGPSSTSTPTPSASTAITVQQGATPGGSFLKMPVEMIGESIVNFPPRDQSLNFGIQLNNLYRDQLRRNPVSTFVDLEGWIVWIQEYLRYRVNGCSHVDASFRVGVQIGGGGIPPICIEAPPGAVPFPPRNESFAFGLDLNATYRDVLRRGPVSAFVDLEGWIVWISEYLRYRVNGCSHDQATFNVGVQIGGGGVPPICGVVIPGGASFLQVRSTGSTCACWVGTITVEVDGVARGTLTCTTSVTVAVTPGNHTVRSCDRTGCVSGSFNVVAGETRAFDLTCGADKRKLSE